jgi:hypothetical protein
MGRGQRRDAAKERHWRRLVKEWRRSGLSVREFCDWQALSEPSFYGWRRELAKRDKEGNSRRTRSVKGTAETGSKSSPFLPVQVVADAGSDSSGQTCLEVQLPTGIRLRVPAGFDPQTLAQVLAALEPNRC